MIGRLFDWWFRSVVCTVAVGLNLAAFGAIAVLAQVVLGTLWGSVAYLLFMAPLTPVLFAPSFYVVRHLEPWRRAS